MNMSAMTIFQAKFVVKVTNAAEVHFPAPDQQTAIQIAEAMADDPLFQESVLEHALQEVDAGEFNVENHPMPAGNQCVSLSRRVTAFVRDFLSEEGLIVHVPTEECK